MKKKGVMWETFADVFLAGLILFFAISMSSYLTSQTQKRIDYSVEQKIDGLDDNEIFVSYLNAKIGDNSLSEKILEAHFTSEEKELEEELDTFFERIYGSKVCWELTRQSLIVKNWLSKNKCSKEDILLNSEILMPLPNKETLKLKLEIKGYANE